MLTIAQVACYQFHRRLCRSGIPGLGPIGQSTLEHRILQGTLSTASPTGNVVYTGPGASTVDLVATTTPIWLITQPMPMRGGGGSGTDTPAGRQAIPLLRGQCPAIDDAGNLLAIAHDDIAIDAGGVKYKVVSPALTPDASLWNFMLEKLR